MMVLMMVMIFLDIYADNGILPCIKVRKNAKVRLKKGTFLEIYQLYLRKMICKSGRIACKLWTKMDCRNCVFLYKKNVW